MISTEPRLTRAIQVHYLLLVRVFLSLVQPLDEGLGSAADLLGSRKIHVFLARLGSPLLDYVLTDEEVLVVELVKDLDDLITG